MFTDDFNRSDENLEASGNWTRVDGSAGGCGVRSNFCAQLSATESMYLCPDQGSAAHYSETENKSGANAWTGFQCIRATNKDNFIGVRGNGATWQLFRRVTGSFTSIGSYSATSATGDISYLEGSGDSITWKLNGTTRIGPVTETNHNSVTRCGLINRASLNPTWDNFEADALGGGGPTGSPYYYYRQQEQAA